MEISRCGQKCSWTEVVLSEIPKINVRFASGALMKSAIHLIRAKPHNQNHCMPMVTMAVRECNESRYLTDSQAWPCKIFEPSANKIALELPIDDLEAIFARAAVVEEMLGCAEQNKYTSSQTW